MYKVFLFFIQLFSISTFFAQARVMPFVNASEHAIMGDTLTLLNLGVEDTIWGTYSYPPPHWGCTTGQNSYGDLGWAEKYEVHGADSTFEIIGVLGYFTGTVSPNSTGYVSFGVYKANGTSGASLPNPTTYSGVPGTQMGVTTKAYTDIDISGLALEYTPISIPTPIEEDFFISYELEAYNPQTIMDSLRLFVAVDSRPGEDTLHNGQPFCRNAVKWSDNVWYDEYYQNTRLLINYILFPIVIVETGATSVEAGISRNNLSYHGNYPNPATTFSTLQFSLTENTPVVINVYDMSGHLILSQQQGQLFAGSHEVTLDLRDLSAGAYLFSIATNKATIGGMFQVVK